MASDWMDARIERLLVRERNRRVLSAQKQEQLSVRLRLAAAASAEPRGFRQEIRLRALLLHPVLWLASVLFTTGAAVAIMGPTSSWWPRIQGAVTTAAKSPAALPAGEQMVEAPRPSQETDVGESLRAEVQMIGRARRELAVGHVENAARQLALHARRFPAGALLEEREGLAVMVLWHKGHKQQARQAADRFGLTHPRSPMIRPLKELVDETR